MQWLICLWWSDYADGIVVDVGLIVHELIDHHNPLLLRLMIEISLLLLALDHSSFPSSLLSMYLPLHLHLRTLLPLFILRITDININININIDIEWWTDQYNDIITRISVLNPQWSSSPSSSSSLSSIIIKNYNLNNYSFCFVQLWIYMK